MRAFLLALPVWTALACAAVAGGVSTDDIARLEILPGWRTAEGTHMTALRIELAPGWKTYWRAPGEAGIPPRFDWSGSKNIQSVAFHWPTPQVFSQNGMRTVGYAQELVLPMEFTPRRDGGPIRVRAAVELGVCQDVCVPMSARIRADLETSGAADWRIDAAMNRRPLSPAEAGVRGVDCRVEPIRDGLRVTARIDMPRLAADEMAVFELSDQTVWIAEASADREGRRLTATTEMVPASNAPFFLDRSDVRITVLGAGRAVDIQGCS